MKPASVVTPMTGLGLTLQEAACGVLFAGLSCGIVVVAGDTGVPGHTMTVTCLPMALVTHVEQVLGAHQSAVATPRLGAPVEVGHALQALVELGLLQHVMERVVEEGTDFMGLQLLRALEALELGGLLGHQLHLYMAHHTL
jgi:hypothetical protein